MHQASGQACRHYCLFHNVHMTAMSRLAAARLCKFETPGRCLLRPAACWLHEATCQALLLTPHQHPAHTHRHHMHTHLGLWMLLRLRLPWGPSGGTALPCSKQPPPLRSTCPRSTAASRRASVIQVQQSAALCQHLFNHLGSQTPLRAPVPCLRQPMPWPSAACRRSTAA